MIKRVVSLFIGLLLLEATARAEDGVWVMHFATHLTNSPGQDSPNRYWAAYDGGDGPEGSYMGWMMAGQTAITGRVELAETYPAGTYYVFLKTFEYFVPTNITLTVGDSTVVSPTIPNRIDWNRRWTGPMTNVTSTTFDKIDFIFKKAQATGEDTKVLVNGLYFTTNLNEDVAYLGPNQIINYKHPVEDASAALPGNWLPNSSFEVGYGAYGWGNQDDGAFRNGALKADGDQTAAFHGGRSIKAVERRVWASPIIYLRGNRQYTLSAYVKSNGIGARIDIHFGCYPPNGAGGEWPDGKVLKTNLVTGWFPPDGSWTRFSTSKLMFAYPAQYFQLLIEATNASVDAVQLEEGTLSAYAPREAVEFGFQTDQTANIFYESDTKTIQVLGFNKTAPSTNQLAWEVFDYLNRRVTNGSTAIVCGTTTTINTLTLPTLKRGAFRIVGRLEDGNTNAINGIRNELTFSVLPPVTLSTNYHIGTHGHFYTYPVEVVKRAGFKTGRSLSPATIFRWVLIEPTQGAFDWALTDANVNAAATNGVEILGSIMTNDGDDYVPAFAQGSPVPDLTHFSNFVFASVNRYKDRVRKWEFWNEPGFTFTTNEMAQLHTVWVQASKAADSTCYLVGIGGDHDEEVAKRTWDLIAPGIQSQISAISMHAYSQTIDPNRIEEETRYKDWVALFGASKPLMNTEAGVWDYSYVQTDVSAFEPTGDYFAEWARSERHVWTAVVAAQTVLQNVLRCLGVGFQHYYYYDGRQHTSPAYIRNHTSYLDFNDALKPKGAALAILNQLLGTNNGTGAITNSNQVYAEAYLFEGATNFVAIWSNDRTNRFLTLTNTTGLSQLDMMGNPVTFTNARIYIGRNPSYLVTANSVHVFSNAVRFATVTNSVDTVAPNLSIDMSPHGAVSSNTPLRFKWTALDDTHIPTDLFPTNVLMRWKLLGGDWTAWGQDTWYQTNSIPRGTYQLMVQTKDAANNTNEVAGPSFRVGPDVTTQHQGRLARARGRAR